MHNTRPEILTPVSPSTIEAFDAVVDSVEDVVVGHCISEGHPERTMGPEAAAMIKKGLGFTSKLLRTIIAYGTEKIVEDQLAWGKTTLPGFGVSMTMVLDNFQRYNEALKEKLTPAVYDEIRPYLVYLIQRQQMIA